MDENKDINLTENEPQTEDTQQAVQSAAEETEAAAETEAALNVESDFDASETDTETPDETIDGISADEPASAKKKPVLQTTIIISIIIVCIAVIAALAIKLFFNNDISGTWHLVREVQVMDDGATSDEATHSLDVDYYFNFNSDGTVTSTIGTVTGTGTYTTSKDEDGNNVVTMNIYDTLTQYFLDGDYTMELSGNAFTGRNMKFTSVNNTELSYEFESASYTAPEITREDEFTPNDDIIGTWSYSTGEFKLVYEFDKDGTAKYIEQAVSINPYTYSYINIDISMEGIYSVNDDTVTISYFFLEQASRDMKFRLDGDVLYINDYPFTKDGAATVDQAQTAAAQ